MPPEETPFIRITNREIWDELRTLSGEIRDMKGSMKTVLDEHKDLKTRVRAMELRVYAILATVGTAVGGGVAVLIRAVLG